MRGGRRFEKNCEMNREVKYKFEWKENRRLGGALTIAGRYIPV